MPSRGSSVASSCAPRSGAKTSRVTSHPSCCLLNLSRNEAHSSLAISCVDMIPSPINDLCRMLSRSRHSPEQLSDFFVGGLRKIFVPQTDPVESFGCHSTDNLIDHAAKLITGLSRSDRDGNHNLRWILFP